MLTLTLCPFHSPCDLSGTSSLFLAGKQEPYKKAHLLTGTAGEFSSPVNFVCCLLFGVLSTPVHVKDPGHSAKSAGSRLHLNTHTPMTERSRSGLTMPLSRHCVGTYQERSSHTACQGILDHSRLSSLSLCGRSWHKEWS